MQGIIYIVLAAPFLLNGGAGWKVYKRIGRMLSRKAVAGVGAEESGADFFFGAHCGGAVPHCVCCSGYDGVPCVPQCASQPAATTNAGRPSITSALSWRSSLTPGCPSHLLACRRAGHRGLPCGGQEHPRRR